VFTENNNTIENIILSHDGRGISALRPHLSPSYCHDAARFILAKGQPRRKTAIVATGFYILSAHAPETDGPPGAIAIAKALDALGFDVFLVSDRHTAPLLAIDGFRKHEVIEFPITDHKTSRKIARNILFELQPDVTISIERCGMNAAGKHLNMRGKDISPYTAKVDYLFLDQENTIGIGDGGNEIGMGNLTEEVKKIPSLVPDPATTPVNKLVIASVSNWGGYGLVAALSELTQRDLMPTVTWDRDIITELAARGAVDGISGHRKPAVDNLTTEQHSWVVAELRKFLKDELTAVPVHVRRIPNRQSCHSSEACPVPDTGAGI
jgi:hypothetical protein